MTKHKIILLFLVSFFLIINSSYGQEESVVKLKPILGQGYLVLNKTNYPSVDHWEVDIIKRSHGEGEYQDEIIQSEELPQNRNYMFIPVDYRRQSTAVNYLVNIRGVTINGEVIVVNNRVQLNDRNGPSHIAQRTDGSLPAQMQCEVTCVSGTYAYAIAQYKFPHLPTTHLVFEQALRAFDEDAQIANAFYYYNNVQCDPLENDCIGPLTNSNQVNYFNPAGQQLSGNVYAREKGLGQWDGLNLVSNQLSNTTICTPNYSINNAINLLVGNLTTDSSLNDPPLKCVSANTIGNGGNGGNDGNDGNDGSTGGGPRNIDVVGDFFDSFCVDDNGFPSSDDRCDFNEIGGDLLDPISEILIYDLNTDNPPTIFNVIEDPSNLSFNLEPGLYSFAFAFKDGDFLQGIKEFKREFSYKVTNEESSLITINIFPTPIVENQFWITMVPQATTSFKYELRDANGRLLVDKTFEVEEGNNVEELINEIEIPRGLLFHVFRFQDGSIKTIKSFK